LAVDGCQERERESVFFMGVALLRLAMLQWMALHTYVQTSSSRWTQWDIKKKEEEQEEEKDKMKEKEEEEEKRVERKMWGGGIYVRRGRGHMI
jgi:cell division protein FtsB